MAGMFNIGYCVENSKFAYYYVGIHHNDKMNSTKANIIREVEAKYGDLFINDILKSLDEYFVKNKEVTVLPFYLKYLREFISVS